MMDQIQITPCFLCEKKESKYKCAKCGIRLCKDCRKEHIEDYPTHWIDDLEWTKE